MRWSAVIVLLLSPGCAEERPRVDDPPRCESWQDQIAPLVTSSCGSCHGGATPAAGWDATTYLGLVAGDRVVAGDRDSRLLKVLDPATADSTHAPLVGLLPRLRTWVVDCRLEYVRSSIHDRGLMNPVDPGFHGQLAREVGWNLSLCAGCHGEDFQGGTSGASCLTCHTDGPTSCTSCHGAVPKGGAHRTHILGGTQAGGLRLGCGECHVKPLAFSDVGHLVRTDGTPDPPPAEVTLGARAGATLDGTGNGRQGAPAWDPTSRRCANVYCHGDTLADGKASNTRPAWEGTGEGSCGSCHGLPPSNHGSGRCEVCHPAVVDAQRKLLLPATLHVDGKLALGDGSGGCVACHGGPDGPAPPRDLTGQTASSAVGVGAHASHLGALHRLSGRVACADCHVVPTSVTAVGHLDSELPAEVFPAPLAATSLAFSDGAKPSWDHVGARCTNVYCHGGGTRLAADVSTNLRRQPGWTLGSGEAACGACHGVPPLDGKHDPKLGLVDCHRCHTATVDGSGAIIVTGSAGAEKSAHINGVIDAN